MTESIISAAKKMSVASLESLISELQNIVRDKQIHQMIIDHNERFLVREMRNWIVSNYGKIEPNYEILKSAYLSVPIERKITEPRDNAKRKKCFYCERIEKMVCNQIINMNEICCESCIGKFDQDMIEKLFKKNVE